MTISGGEEFQTINQKHKWPSIILIHCCWHSAAQQFHICTLNVPISKSIDSHIKAVISRSKGISPGVNRDEKVN